MFADKSRPRRLHVCRAVTNPTGSRACGGGFLADAALVVEGEGEGEAAHARDDAPPLEAPRLRGPGHELELWSAPSSYVHPSAPG